MKIVTFILSILVLILSILLCLTYEVNTRYSEIKYTILEDTARDDVKFLESYVGKMNLQCINESYKFKSQYFDELVKEIKLNPNIVRYRKLDLDERYLRDSRELLIFTKLIDSFGCTHHIIYSSNYMDDNGVIKLCFYDFKNIKKIDLSHNLFGETVKEFINSIKNSCEFNIFHGKDNVLILYKGEL